MRIISDSSTVVAYLRKQGGVRSPQLAALTWDILMMCQKRTIQILVRHIAGSKNILADTLSRRTVPTEWALHPEITKSIFRVWDTPNIDLFATAHNHKLPVYVSPVPDTNAWATDSLSMDWKNLYGYAFPPSPIIPKILAKLKTTASCDLILIAPHWPRQSWWSSLLELLTDHPLQIPAMQQLLRQKGQYHPRPELFNYHAWRVSGDSRKRMAFQRRLQILPPTASVNQVQTCTTADGRSSVIGVREGRLILSRPLSR